jgi:hypothetical protein
MKDILLKAWGWIRTPPPRYAGNLLLNRLGYQIFRIFWFNSLYHLFKWPRSTKHLEPYASAFKRDGAIIVPNLLSEEAYRELKAAYDKAKENIHFVPLDPTGEQNKGKPAKVGKARVEMKDHPELFALIKKYFLENSYLKDLGSVSTRRRIKRFKTPVVFIHKIINPDGVDFGPVAMFHYDSVYPSIKMFYYLSDIDEGNGAFTFAKGTHRMTWKRLKYEYRKSVLWATYNDKNPGVDVDEEGVGFYNPDEKDIRELSIVPTPMKAKANSIVMFNNMGFHKRGAFSDARPREMLEISYRA